MSTSDRHRKAQKEGWENDLEPRAMIVAGKDLRASGDGGAEGQAAKGFAADTYRRRAG